MTSQVKRCPYRYVNNLVNISSDWDSRCKFLEGHEGEHEQAGTIITSVTAQQTAPPFSGWVKDPI